MPQIRFATRSSFHETVKQRVAQNGRWHAVDDLPFSFHRTL
jgi:hypothetical protein